MLKDFMSKSCKDFFSYNSFKIIALLVLGFLLLTRLFPTTHLYVMGGYALLLCGILERKNNTIGAFLLCLVLFLLLVCAPSLMWLWACLAFLFYCNKDLKLFTPVPLLLQLLQEFNILFSNYQTLILATLGFSFIFVCLYRYQKLVVVILSALCLCMSIGNECLQSKVFLDKPKHINVFTFGDVVERNTGTSFVKHVDKDTRIMRSPSFLTQVRSEQPGIVVFDVDQKRPNRFLTGEKWQQPTSWHDNVLLGNCYFQEALYTDGALYSNKGLALKDTAMVELAYPTNLVKSQPLIIKDLSSDIEYLHDSDYTSDYLSNYQRSFLKELLHSGSRSVAIRLIVVCFCLLIICSFYADNRVLIRINQVILFVCLPFLIYTTFVKSSEGDIRMVGKIGDSHDNIRFSGVPKKIVEAGFPYILGEKQAKILVVKEGETATWSGEKIVIAEPMATIKLDGEVLKVIDEPLGMVKNVIDAREWEVNGTNIHTPIMVKNNIKFIATGSPAQQIWKKLLDVH